MKKRLFITGISGLLGSNLAYCLRDEYEILGCYHEHKVLVDGARTIPLDLTAKHDVNRVVGDFTPDIIFHAAAQANVEICESNPELAQKINVESTVGLRDVAQQYKAKFVYVSTDLVYGGTGLKCTEDEEPSPLSVYARTKLEGERAALSYNESLILRTNFFGWNIQSKASLAEWVVSELRDGKSINGFTDTFFSSIYTFDLAKLIGAALNKNLCGIYNCGASSALSKYDFLVKVAMLAGLNTKLVKPISVDDFQFKARRSKNLRLDVSKIERDAGLRPPEIEESINHFVRDLPENYARSIGVEITKGHVYPKLNCIPYGRQAIDDDDISAVVETLKSSHLTQGPRIEEFEQALCHFTGACYSTVVNSGTSALHVGCLSIGLGKGDEGVTSTNTFVASANCMAYCGAKPVFADIDPLTYNVTPESILEKITEKTKVVIPVHFAGRSCDMKGIYDVVRQKEKEFGHRIYIIEDASHALGSIYQGHNVGACPYSDMVVTSFHPVKHITMGEGGALFTNDKTLHRMFCYFRSHGISNSLEELENMDQAFEDETRFGKGIRRPWYYEQHHLGYNYRSTDIQCALGISQLRKLPEFIKKRQKIVEFYHQELKGVSCLQLPAKDVDDYSNFHLYVLKIDFPGLEISRAEVMGVLKAENIVTQVHYIPVHTQSYYQKHFGTNWGDCPEAEQYYQQCLSIPLYPLMRSEDQSKVVYHLKRLLEK